LQGAQKTTLSKNQWPNAEIGKWTGQKFFKEVQKTHEEMLNICGHKGNANHYHIKIPPHRWNGSVGKNAYLASRRHWVQTPVLEKKKFYLTPNWLSSRIQTTTNVGENVGKREPLYTVET
jgi:hypothetical protein